MSIRYNCPRCPQHGILREEICPTCKEKADILLQCECGQFFEEGKKCPKCVGKSSHTEIEKPTTHNGQTQKSFWDIVLKIFEKIFGE